ncbi:hypothetical protein TcG_02189 [Trypanosoma cruzi]|uniref:Uncharacterized protein n=1 Tax=Trypanosoma cruzi TaxID=5693 RepID=A0A2V2VJN1_TRYCR|nr:hypothetical protein TcBrA4_0019300 [Trypanosoma cruzi]PBJ77971.1 hypothetical protein BCY84_05379 [Trypanosoma cruzi cruzi]PWU95612.1 hypothetical protein C4B63_21g44 [Trypanosoma cruzi]RNF22504.1 hypothetical protein TcG_02189 [Trypanosoma cruzi]
MQTVIQQIHQANLKAVLLSRINLFFIIFNCVAMLILIVTWSVSIAKEGGGVLARYAACIISFILLAVATFLSAMVHRKQPQLLLYYAHEAISILALILTAISMGTNDVVVDLCNTKRALSNTQCGSHTAELLAQIMACISMGFNYASTQQRIVNFIDKGILDGIRGRSGGMTQLP